MSKKIKTITKEWEIGSPYMEKVEDYIKRIRESCDNVRRDFSGFISYSFTISSSTYMDYGNPNTEVTIKMTCTRYETDNEKKKRLETNEKRKATHAINEKRAIAKEKDKMYKLMEKYNIEEG